MNIKESIKGEIELHPIPENVKIKGAIQMFDMFAMFHGYHRKIWLDEGNVGHYYEDFDGNKIELE